MKIFSITSLILMSISALSYAEDHGGFYCTKSDSKGEASMSFVPTSPVSNEGVMIIKLPNQPVTVVPSAERHWSGSMFITSGNGFFIQGPGNSVPEIGLLDKDANFNPSATFDYKSQCQGI